MKKLSTFESDELDAQIFHIYYEMCQSAESAALMYVRTIKDNNPFHFEHFLERQNKAIEKLQEISPNPQEVKLLDKETLIKEATRFLNADLY